MISVNAMNSVDLLKGLKDQSYIKALREKTLAHYIGNDLSGNPVIGDFAEEVHVLSTGTTNSGKSCSATSMILSLACFYSPKKVNLILCDKAAGLNKFSELPHCTCKCVRTDEDFEAVMYMVFDEMERRSQLEGTEEFRKMSHIIIMIDEFPSFLSQDKKSAKIVHSIIADILRRGRHAKIHIVIFSTIGTSKKLDLEKNNLATKMCFRVSTSQESVSVIGRSGAEKLGHQGEMLYTSPVSGGIQHIQGAYIDDSKIPSIIQWCIERYCGKPSTSFQPLKLSYPLQEKKLSFFISEFELEEKKQELASNEEYSTGSFAAKRKPFDDDKIVAAVMMSLRQEQISCNRIKSALNIGWERASKIMEKLTYLGIVDNPEGKVPRAVVLKDASELTDDAREWLSNHGLSDDKINEAINHRLSNQ